MLRRSIEITHPNPTMKTTLARATTLSTALLMTVAGLAAISGTPCNGQGAKQVTKESTTMREIRVDGRLHVTGPESVAIISGTADPVTYRYGDSFQFVDEEGRLVAREAIAPGTPVTVVTVPEARGGIVTSRVIVHKSTTTTVPPEGGKAVATTTVTETVVKPTKANGVLLERESDRILVKTPEGGNVTFTYSQVTDFTDSEGRHVDLIKFIPGMPVHIDFKQVGDRLEASRVMLQGRLKD